MIDEDLQPRGGTRFLEDGSAEVIVDGEVLLAIPPDDALSTGVIGFTGDGAGLYAVSSIDRNAAALVRFDLNSGAVETLAADPTYDVHAVELHPLTRELEIVSFERARVEHVVVDPRWPTTWPRWLPRIPATSSSPDAIMPIDAGSPPTTPTTAR